MELLKFIICTFYIFSSTNYSWSHTSQLFKDNLINSPKEVLKLSVPSFLYALQNNLLYLALSNLDSASYQVIYQSKILTTALFSVFMLGEIHCLIRIISSLKMPRHQQLALFAYDVNDLCVASPLVLHRLLVPAFARQRAAGPSVLFARAPARRESYRAARAIAARDRSALYHTVKLQNLSIITNSNVHHPLSLPRSLRSQVKN